MIGVHPAVPSSGYVVASVKTRILALSSCGCPTEPREVVDATSLAVFKVRLDRAEGNLI